MLKSYSMISIIWGVLIKYNLALDQLAFRDAPCSMA